MRCSRPASSTTWRGAAPEPARRPSPRRSRPSAGRRCCAPRRCGATCQGRSTRRWTSSRPCWRRAWRSRAPASAKLWPRPAWRWKRREGSKSAWARPRPPRSCPRGAFPWAPRSRGSTWARPCSMPWRSACCSGGGAWPPRRARCSPPSASRCSRASRARPLAPATGERDWKGALAAGELEGARAALPPIFMGFGETHLAEALRAPSGGHPLGTDGLGRDVLVRLLWGGRASLAVAFASAALLLSVGVALGALAGFHGGRVDLLLARVIEVFQCFPTFLLIVTAAALIPEQRLHPLVALVLVIALVNWTGVARLVRAEFLRARELDYVAAARAHGLLGAAHRLRPRAAQRAGPGAGGRGLRAGLGRADRVGGLVPRLRRAPPGALLGRAAQRVAHARALVAGALPGPGDLRHGARHARPRRGAARRARAARAEGGGR